MKPYPPKQRERSGTLWVVWLVSLILASSSAGSATNDECLSCHQEVTPGITKEWALSRHYAAGVDCLGCHGTELGPEKGGFAHHGQQISVIVSPLVCKTCHQREYEEFSLSAHSRAYDCASFGPCAANKSGQTTISCGKLAIGYLQGGFGRSSTSPSFGLTKDAGANAAGIAACWQCHGSEVKLEDGRPRSDTWPNAGVGRINPDGSRGNCSACHQRHTFSLAEARRPELCGVCHNEGGGEPQLEIYNSSRHGALFYLNLDKMNLGSPRWIAGEDYSAAPTCATCHMSAARGMPTTHNVDERILQREASMGEEIFTKLEIARQLTCRCGPAFCTDCKTTEGDWAEGYDCKISTYPGSEPQKQHMSGVCQSCHSSLLTTRFFAQYAEVVELVMTQWVEPGRRLHQLASAVLEAARGHQYVANVNPVTDAWSNLCNHGAKYPIYGASMMSPGFTESGLGAIGSDWRDGFVPAVAAVIDEHLCSDKPEVRSRAERLKKEFCDVLSDPSYGSGLRREHSAETEPDPSFCNNFLSGHQCPS
ncbi:MAG: hypothetical protein HC897_04330 [Thermoanaerobaculia bacterium]|nr:hypothetical protein [Thermoanaerobaculia bacterium]